MSAVEIPEGLGAAGCAGCHEVFTSRSAFDQHQRMPPSDERVFGKMICFNPADAGLVLRERAYAGEVWQIWGYPETDPSLWEGRR